MKNNDEKCFKYAVLAGLYKPSDHVDRVSSYTPFEAQENVPDFSMLTFPVTLRSIGKFEEKNDISVNVYAGDEKERELGNEKQLMMDQHQNDVEMNLLMMNVMMMKRVMKMVIYLI